MSDDNKPSMKKYRVEVRDPETGESREFPWLPARTESGAAHQGRVQFLRTPFFEHDDAYDRLEVAVSEIPQG